MKRLVLFTFIAVLALAAPASAQSQFGEMFPDLPALDQHSAQQLADLAQLQLDPNLDSENNCTVTTPPVEGCVFTGFTYLGQFLDHDLTLDTSPSPTAPVDVTTLTNNRTFKLDLDSVYGGGPSGSPQLYDGNKFKVQEPNANGVRDLPRNDAGRAILVEARNDENQIIAQLHLAFLKAHNAFIDQGLSFSEARRQLTLHYQQMVIDDYLPHVLNRGSLPHSAAGILQDGQAAHELASGMTPVEFSVASFRFGHSQVRRAYRLNGNNNCANLQVFNLANPVASLMGGRMIQAGRQIDWGQFFEQFPEPVACTGLRNIGRKVDTLISSSLFQLPIPGAEAAGDNVLAFRNMIRAKFYDIPSGQSVADRLGEPVLTNEQLIDPVENPDLAAAFADGVPLWYYILAESSATEDGQRLGPIGTRLNGAVFASVLKQDADSIWKGNSGWNPDPDIAGPDGTVEMADIIRHAGVVR